MPNTLIPSTPEAETFEDGISLRRLAILIDYWEAKTAKCRALFPPIAALVYFLICANNTFVQST
jgi:hypothetical protein